MKTTFRYALRRSLPILLGFVPLGLAYGVLMRSAGYNFLWSGACSFFVLAGSLQFLMVSFLTGAMPIATVAVMALLLNSRHIFYGLPFLEKFRAFGPWRYYLIFGLSDEVFSQHCDYRPTPGVDEKWSFIFSTMLVHVYWVVSTIAGGLLGALIRFDTTGIDFSLTALFIVILLDQMHGADVRLPAALAAASGVVCILVFGAANFILPSLVITSAGLMLLRPRLEREAA